MAELFRPPFVFQFQKCEGLKFFVIHSISMGYKWFTSTIVSFLRFLQIKEGRPNFLGWTNSVERLHHLVSLLYFSFRNLKDPNSSRFISYQWVLDEATLILSIFWNLFKLRRGDLISWGEPILQNGWIIWSPLLYFNFRVLNYSNSWSFIRFQWILNDSQASFSFFWNIVKLRRGDPTCWGEPIL